MKKNLNILYRYRDGRRILLSYFHKILSIIGNEDIDEISKKRVIPQNGDISLPANFNITPALGAVLGYIVSEGTITSDSVHISNIDKECLADIKRSLEKIGVPFFQTATAIISGSRVFVELIHALGASGKSQTKKVAPFIFGSNKKVIASYISAYFEGDGEVDGQQVTATSKSEELLSGLSYLLFGFGIVARIRRKTVKYKGRPRKFFILAISGQDNLRAFQEKINFRTTRKQETLKNLCLVEGNTNVDTIPGLAPLFLDLREHFGSQLSMIPNLSPLSRGVYNPSPKELGRIVSDIEERVATFKQSASATRNLHVSFLDYRMNLKNENSALSASFERGMPARTSYSMIRNASVHVAETYNTLSFLASH